MKYIFIPLLLVCNLLYAQHKEEADNMVRRGVPYHDNGDYTGALKRYDSALAADKNNVLALVEKAYTLMIMEKYDESIDYCKKAIKTHPKDEDLKMLYVTYGTDYDYQKKTDQSIAAYEEGINVFPDFYLLYFNKGITLASINRYDEAEACYKKALALNPNHPGSNNALARILYNEDKKIPALMTFCRFLVLEPQSDRAKENLGYVQKIMEGNAEKNSSGGVTIHVDANSINDSVKKENNFGMVELIMSMGAAISLDTLKLSAAGKFSYNFSAVCGELKELKGKNYGYYWDCYAPYFIEMKEKDMIETFAHIAFASTDDKENNDWLNAHKNDIDNFFDWSKEFNWKQK